MRFELIFTINRSLGKIRLHVGALFIFILSSLGFFIFIYMYSKDASRLQYIFSHLQIKIRRMVKENWLENYEH